jgi:hypothetical protein
MPTPAVPRSDAEICNDLVTFLHDNRNLIPWDIQPIRDKFLGLRHEVESKYPNSPCFNHPVYTSLSFEWNMDNMIKTAEELRDFLWHQIIHDSGQ